MAEPKAYYRPVYAMLRPQDVKNLDIVEQHLESGVTDALRHGLFVAALQIKEQQEKLRIRQMEAGDDSDE